MSKIYNVSTSIQEIKDIVSNIRDDDTRKSLIGILNLINIRNTKIARSQCLDILSKFTNVVFNSTKITNFVKMELMAFIIEILAEYGDNKYEA